MFLVVGWLEDLKHSARRPQGSALLAFKPLTKSSLIISLPEPLGSSNLTQMFLVSQVWKLKHVYGYPKAELHPTNL